jgi:hypothetical protein
MASILLDAEKRAKLGERLERDARYCPRCKGAALVSRNGDWRCTASTPITGRNSVVVYDLLTCGATGVTLGDELVVLQPVDKEDEDQDVSDAS